MNANDSKWSKPGIEEFEPLIMPSNNGPIGAAFGNVVDTTNARVFETTQADAGISFDYGPSTVGDVQESANVVTAPCIPQARVDRLPSGQPVLVVDFTGVNIDLSREVTLDDLSTPNPQDLRTSLRGSGNQLTVGLPFGQLPNRFTLSYTQANGEEISFTITVDETAQVQVAANAIPLEPDANLVGAVLVDEPETAPVLPPNPNASLDDVFTTMGQQTETDMAAALATERLTKEDLVNGNSLLPDLGEPSQSTLDEAFINPNADGSGAGKSAPKEPNDSIAKSSVERSGGQGAATIKPGSPTETVTQNPNKGEEGTGKTPVATPPVTPPTTESSGMPLWGKITAGFTSLLLVAGGYLGVRQKKKRDREREDFYYDFEDGSLLVNLDEEQEDFSLDNARERLDLSGLEGWPFEEYPFLEQESLDVYLGKLIEKVQTLEEEFGEQVPGLAHACAQYFVFLLQDRLELEGKIGFHNEQYYKAWFPSVFGRNKWKTRREKLDKKMTRLVFSDGEVADDLIGQLPSDANENQKSLVRAAVTYAALLVNALADFDVVYKKVENYFVFRSPNAKVDAPQSVDTV